MISGAPKNVLDYGAFNDGTNATATTAAIQTALDLAGAIYLPAGTYLIDSPLVVKNNTLLFGDGNSSLGGSKSSLISYAGLDNAIEINNTINGSTAAYITMRDFAVFCTNASPTALKACISDTASSYLHIDQVTVHGNWAGIILDQTEVSTVSKCVIEAQSIVGLWLVNGNAHNAAANQYFTNQITISNNQFNRVALANTFAIIDDGGADHEFKNNNINGWGTWMRLASQTNTKITNNEFEGAADVGPIAFWNVTSFNSQSVAAGTTCTFDTNIIGVNSLQNAISILGGGNTQNTITLISNIFSDQTLVSVKNSNNLAALNLIGNYPNTQMLRETTAPALLFDYLAGDWTPVNNEVTIVVNSAKYVKIGRSVTLSFDVTWPATANASVTYIGGLPFAVASSSFASSVVGSSTGANAQYLFIDPVAQTIAINRTSVTTNTNADLSTYRMKGSITYITSQ